MTYLSRLSLAALLMAPALGLAVPAMAASPVASMTSATPAVAAPHAPAKKLHRIAATGDATAKPAVPAATPAPATLGKADAMPAAKGSVAPTVATAKVATPTVGAPTVATHVAPPAGTVLPKTN